MTSNQDLNSLNLWDLQVTSIRFFQPSDVGRPTYDLILELDIPPNTLAPDSPRHAAQFRFRECLEFGAAIDVGLWTMIGPELAEGSTVPFARDRSFTRYKLELRPPAGSLEVVARSLSYDGPDLSRVLPDSSASMNLTWNELQQLIKSRNEK